MIWKATQTQQSCVYYGWVDLDNVSYSKAHVVLYDLELFTSWRYEHDQNLLFANLKLGIRYEAINKPIE